MALRAGDLTLPSEGWGLAILRGAGVLDDELEPGSIVRRSSRHYVEIEADSALSRGMSVVDGLDVSGRRANTEVVWELEVAHIKEMVFRAARSPG